MVVPAVLVYTPPSEVDDCHWTNPVLPVKVIEGNDPDKVP